MGLPPSWAAQLKHLAFQAASFHFCELVLSKVEFPVRTLQTCRTKCPLFLSPTPWDSRPLLLSADRRSHLPEHRSTAVEGLRVPLSDGAQGLSARSLAPFEHF